MQSKSEQRHAEMKISNAVFPNKRIMTSPISIRSHALSHIKDVAESRKNKRQTKHGGANLDSNMRVEAQRGSPVTSSSEHCVTDSDFLSQPVSDGRTSQQQQRSAAIKIQCVWRGHCARQYCPQVKWVREEMRRRRMEEHIIFLKDDLQRHKLLYKKEKQVSSLQLEAIKHLWKEVQSLQCWRHEMISDESNITSQKHLNKEIENTMEKIEVIRGQEPYGEKAVILDGSETRMNTELELTCSGLKSKMEMLEDTVQDLSHTVLYCQEMSQVFQHPFLDNKEGSICVRMLTEALQETDDNSTPNWAFTSVSPKSHTQVYGVPTPPTGLVVSRRGSNSLLLTWKPSNILNMRQAEIQKPLIGYRVYVNDEAEGMVAGNQSTAVLEGLHQPNSYRIYVKAVSSVGESSESNIVTATPLCAGTPEEPSSTDNSSDDTDGEDNNTNIPAKYAGSVQCVKKKSPHGDKTANRNRSARVQGVRLMSRKDSSSADESPHLHTPKVKSTDLSVISGETVHSDSEAFLTTRPPTSGYSPKAEERLRSPRSTQSRDSSPKHQPGRRPRHNDSSSVDGIPEPIVCWEETVDNGSAAVISSVTSPKASSDHGQDSKDNSQQCASILMKPKQVLEGKKKPFDAGVKPLEKSVCKSSVERRRTTVSDILEQRFANKQPTASQTIDSSANKPGVDGGDFGKIPTEISPPGTDSPFTIQSRTQGTFVSKLLQKLQTFSQAHEQSIRDSKIKLRGKSCSDSALSGTEGDDTLRWRRISTGDESEEDASGVLSDSAQCTTTKPSKQHRRSSSMHGAGPFVGKDMAAIEGTHSPIIMEGGKKKVSPTAGSSAVRRHASFNGLLPSKTQEIRPNNEDSSGVKVKAIPKPSPLESSGQPTFRSRSPSPNASVRSGVHQPVLSAAQLQRLKSPAGIGQ